MLVNQCFQRRRARIQKGYIYLLIDVYVTIIIVNDLMLFIELNIIIY